MFLPPGMVRAPASIEPTSQGFVIKLDQNLRTRTGGEYRLRSRAAHELMHALFYDTTVLPPLRPWSGPPTRKSYLAEEELCNFLAREFLVPGSVLRTETHRRPTLGEPNLASMNALKKEFDVSSDVLAYRLIRDLGIWQALFAKYLKSGTVFKVTTRVKSSSGTLFRKLKIPGFIGQQAGVWHDTLRQGISVSATGRSREAVVNLFDHEVKLESGRDSVDPLTVIFLASDACHQSVPLVERTE